MANVGVSHDDTVDTAGGPACNLALVLVLVPAPGPLASCGMPAVACH